MPKYVLQISLGMPKIIGMTKPNTPDEIIDALGGTSEVARLCEIQPPSVSEWRRRGIPKAQLKFLRLARPDVFEVPAETLPQRTQSPN